MSELSTRQTKSINYVIVHAKVNIHYVYRYYFVEKHAYRKKKKIQRNGQGIRVFGRPCLCLSKACGPW